MFNVISKKVYSVHVSDVKQYCRRNKLFFLYCFMRQYSNSYWSGSQLYLMQRLDSNLATVDRRFSEQDLIALNNAIKQESFSILDNRDSESSESHRVHTKYIGQSSKVYASSSWAREYIAKYGNKRSNVYSLRSA